MASGFFVVPHTFWEGFPHSLVGKESACNARDPGSFPGSGRSPGEGIDYPLQYSWASLVAQMLKNLPTMQETWVRLLGWEDLLEEGMATHASILAWRYKKREKRKLPSSVVDMVDSMSLGDTWVQTLSELLDIWVPWIYALHPITFPKFAKFKSDSRALSY